MPEGSRVDRDVASASRAPSIGPDLSLYLDVLRIVAAASVVFAHLRFDRLKGEWLGQAPNIGVEGVMAFFVLSGFVITYAACRNEHHLSDFAVNRFSRIYSVAVPALLITAIIDTLGIRIAPEVYDGGSRSLEAILASLTFANQIWWNNIAPFSDGPYWSLAHEFWYYAIFAAFFYLERPLGLLAGLGVMALVGPKILLLFPAWLIGHAAYRIVRARRCGPALGAGLFAGSLVLIGVYFYVDLRGQLSLLTIDLLSERRFHALAFARFFLSYLVFGTLVAINIVGFAAVSGEGSALLARWARPIRAVANSTFTLYLLHLPLLHFFSALMRGVAAPLHSALILACTIAAIAAIAPVTEGKKHLWRSAIRRLIAGGARRPLVSHR